MRTMKTIIFLLALVVNLAQAQTANNEYPIRPNTNKNVTPGKLCDAPTRYRYPEQIAYCERDVTSETKELVFINYRKLGYRLSPNQRSSYKIDHFIPLCAGGSNDIHNLWPQHKTVYERTDLLEALACEKLSTGLVTQAQTVKMIMAAKVDMSLLADTYRFFQNL
jgi:hypothetical protein